MPPSGTSEDGNPPQKKTTRDVTTRGRHRDTLATLLSSQLAERGRWGCSWGSKVMRKQILSSSSLTIPKSFFSSLHPSFQLNPRVSMCGPSGLGLVSQDLLVAPPAGSAPVECEDVCSTHGAVAQHLHPQLEEAQQSPSPTLRALVGCKQAESPNRNPN